MSYKCPEIAVFFDLASESARGMLRGFMQYVRLNSPWNVNFISRTASDVAPSSLKNWAGDGILAHIPNVETFREILSKNCPVVFLARENDEGFIASSLHHWSCEGNSPGSRIEPVFIKCDNGAVGRLAADYFLKKNFRHFAYVPYPKDVCWCIERRQAYVETLAQKGFQTECFSLPGEEGANWFEQRDRMRSWLESLPKPVAIFAVNDFRGRQVLEVCQRAGIPVPYDVAVLGVDDDVPVCEMCYPSLSSIAIDWGRAGFLSAQALDQMINNEKANWGTYGPIQVVSRNSTEQLHVSDRLVVQILELIRINRSENLRVADILASLPISERRAQERFKSAMGHSIMEEMKQVRMENICELIETTDLSFNEIALSFGFENANHLGQLFKKEFGLTMGEFRKRNR
ncbi:MAG: DNA-binding transcriptional regulator [Planctomycetia bacterium]|nr:DNA-binding transcriptional regulator [Planctomycetia bacterium]